MRREREWSNSSRSSACCPVQRSVVMVLSSGAGARRCHRRLGHGRIPPQLMMAAAATADAAVGQLLRLEKLLVLGDAQPFAVDHARPLRPRSRTPNNSDKTTLVSFIHQVNWQQQKRINTINTKKKKQIMSKLPHVTHSQHERTVVRLNAFGHKPLLALGNQRLHFQ